jgi:predicted nucleic acid-binding Zn ribbon protein
VIPPGKPPPRRRRRRPGVDPGPRRLAEGLDEAVARLAPPDAPSSPSASSLSAVFTRWEEIVGPKLARHVRPLRLSGGVLVVAADHPARATQVRALGASLLDRVRDVSGESPDRLQVTVRPAPPAPRTHPEGGDVG